ncbi:MAG: hypothetical protein AAF804_20000, partial [Bacteroidota bacterium]
MTRFTILLGLLGIAFIGVKAQDLHLHQDYVGWPVHLPSLEAWLDLNYPLKPNEGERTLTYDLTSPGGRHFTFEQEVLG